MRQAFSLLELIIVVTVLSMVLVLVTQSMSAANSLHSAVSARTVVVDDASAVVQRLANELRMADNSPAQLRLPVPGSSGATSIDYEYQVATSLLATGPSYANGRRRLHYDRSAGTLTYCELSDAGAVRYQSVIVSNIISPARNDNNDGFKITADATRASIDLKVEQPVIASGGSTAMVWEARQSDVFLRSSLATATGLNTYVSGGGGSGSTSGTSGGTSGTTTTSELPAPVVSGPASIAGMAGSALSAQITASNSPTVYAVTGLPSGVSLNPQTGVISGSPTVSGVFDLSITAGNATGTSAAYSSQAVISAIASSGIPVINSPVNATANVGTTFTYVITATNSPTSFTATGRPAWLTLSGSTLSGTPTLANISSGMSITLGASNSGGSGSATLSLIVNPSASTIGIIQHAPAVTPKKSSDAYWDIIPPYGYAISTVAVKDKNGGTMAITRSAFSAGGSAAETVHVTTTNGTKPLTLSVTTTKTGAASVSTTDVISW